MKKSKQKSASKEFLEVLGKQYAKQLISRITKWEAIFYKYLKDLHYNFEFQVPVVVEIRGGHKLYILDFLLKESNLVIEIDGISTHGTKQAESKDRLRTKRLQKLGYRVIRFKNTQVTKLSKEDINKILKTLIVN